MLGNRCLRFLSVALVHEAGKATDVGLVNLNVALKPVKGFGLHRQADTVEHEPRSLLGHAKGAAQLVAADSVLGIDQEPDRREPLLQADGRVLEDCPKLDAELLLAALALPDAAGLEEGLFLGATDRAGDAIRPTQASQEGEAYIGMGEVPDGANKAGGCGDGLGHGPKIPHSPWCVKYVIAA